MQLFLEDPIHRLPGPLIMSHKLNQHGILTVEDLVKNVSQERLYEILEVSYWASDIILALNESGFSLRPK